MLDGWTNVFQVPGKRTTGTGAQTYAITGPGWKGTLPAGVKEYKSPTSIVWILGRIYCTGTPEDYAAVHALQDQCQAHAAERLRKAYTPPDGKVDPSIDMKTAVRDQVNRHGCGGILYPACSTDEGQSAGGGRCALSWPSSPRSDSCPVRISMRPSSTRISSSGSRKSPSTGSCCNSKSARPSRTSMVGAIRPRREFTGQTISMRAIVTAIGLGANRPQDAVYPTSLKGRGRQGVRRSEQIRHALSQRGSCRRSRAFGR